jgi:hypothetical protein
MLFSDFTLAPIHVAWTTRTRRVARTQQRIGLDMNKPSARGLGLQTNNLALTSYRYQNQI